MAIAGPISSAGGLVGKWFGSAISEATAFAAGVAIGPVLGPPVQALKNATWSKYPDVPPPFAILAEGVAQGQVAEGQARTWAAEQGIGDAQFTALISIANSGPPLGGALEAVRRGLLTDGQYNTALNRQGIEPEWYPALLALKDVLLSPAELANARQQGFIDQARQYAEATQHGVSNDRAEIQFELAGLPPGVETGLQMLRRGIITTDDFAEIVRTGHTKTKWTAALEQLQKAILSPIQYVDARVRGWIDNAAMNTGGALSGYSPDDMNLLHLSHGRPLSFHQVWIGLARGGKMLDPTANLTAAGTGIDPAFFKALQESNIRQEWYDLAWRQRYTYPAAFVLRTLATSGDLTQAETEQILLYEGWEPTLAAKVAAKWAGGTGTTAAQKKQTLAHLTGEYLSGALSRAGLTTALEALGYTPQQANDEITLAEYESAKAERTRATRALEKRFVAAQLSAADATTALAGLGLPPAAITQKLNAWTELRNAALTTLTVAQVQKGYKAGALDQATATTLLQDLGEDAQAIATLLASA